jgi:putative ABC transport system permease protein
MYYRAIRNDVLRSKAVSLTILLFVAAAAMLVALAATLVVNLSGAIDALMQRAQTPHFMQMHVGDLDRARMNGFADENEALAQHQVLEFLNLDGTQFVFAGGSLADSVQDNGLTVQSEAFDFLLDLDGEVISVTDGQIYVPLTYMQDGLARVGDSVTVAGRTLTVAGPLRDSQMQPLLSSSKRFLVSHDDFEAIRPFGSVEYLIEFRLRDLSMLGAFETAYTTAGLEANGPTITYPLFRTLNGLADGLMIAVILLVSALVIAIAFLCIRFTLLAKIEDDYREIGVMKAIGLRVSDIKRIYLAKYAALAAAGSLVGFGVSFLFQNALLANIRLYLGESANAALAPLLGLVGVSLVCVAIIVYVNGVLGRFRKIAPAEAIRFGMAQESSRAGKRFRLTMNGLLGTNVFLGLQDVLARRKLYATMLVVLVLAAFIIIVPRNLHHTIASETFATYMGVGDMDLRLDVQQVDDTAARVAEIVTAIENDPDVARYVVLTTHSFRTRLADGSEGRIMVELGDHSVFPVTYAAGHAPTRDDEIALSAMNASDMGKGVGDVLPLTIAGQERSVTVSGIYSDVTNGGKTAKATFADDTADVLRSVIGGELRDGALVDEKTAAYAARFEFAKVSDIDEFIMQTYGSTIAAIGRASLAAIGIAVTTTILITLLFMRMLVAKDRYAIAVMKAFGFTNSDIKTQYVARSVVVLVIGILLGTLLANTLGEALAGAVIATFGATSFAFVVDPTFAYGLSPLLMLVATLVATIAGTWDAGRIRVAENLRE